MKEIFNKKYFKYIIFFLSAIILALIASIILKNIAKPYETNDSILIENQKKGLLIGNKTLGDVVDDISNEEYYSSSNNEYIDNLESSMVYEDEFFNIETNIETSQTNSFVEEPNYEIDNNIKVNPDAIIIANEISGVPEEDLYFLQDIVNISDEITIDYTDTLGFALSGDFASGLSNISNLRKDLERIKALQTNDEILNKVKDNIVSGTEKYIEGFEKYFNYEQDANTYLEDADSFFYVAQMFLQEYLDNIRQKEESYWKTREYMI